MTTDDRDAARPMWAAKWPWVLVPMVIVVAGCLPKPPDVPADALAHAIAYFGNEATFTEQPRPAGQTGQDIVAALEAKAPFGMLGGRVATPVLFGLLDCHGRRACAAGPEGKEGGPPRMVWIVLYPDCTTPPDQPEIGFAIVDAVVGVNSAFWNGPCPQE
jgi:hypothetical protein